MSNDTNGVFDMIQDEKTAKMDPEKWAAINDPRSQHPSRNGTDDDDRIMVAGLPVRRVEPRMSTPGAYRVGDTESDYGGRTVGGDSDDESEFMVVPKAALVNDKDEKDGVMKDIEAPSSNAIPIVKAQRSFPDAMRSQPARKKSTHKRKFRCCMILCCLLVAMLLGGVLYFLSKDELPALMEAATGDDGGDNDGGNNNNTDNDNGGDNDGDGRGGGGGGRGNGRGNDND